MTKSKGQRLIQELVDKYNNPTVAIIYDYYATRIITNPNNLRECKNPEDVIVREIKLSDISNVTSWDDIKRFEDVACGRRPVEKYPVEVKESKEIYESEEQQKLRKKHREDFGTFMSHMMSPYAYPFRNVERMFDLSKQIDHMSRTNVKDFGMAMDNHRKRK